MGIEVRPAIGRWDDFASFMMPRKPVGRGCVCMVYRNSSLDMPGRIAYMRALCDSEPVGCQKCAWPVSCATSTEPARPTSAGMPMKMPRRGYNELRLP